MISIEEIIAKEANTDSEHGIQYRIALRQAYELYKDKSIEQLKAIRKISRELYCDRGNTHYLTAGLMVSYFLIKDKKEGK